MSMIRGIATVGGATLVSRLLGFARDILLAGLFGAGARADAFFVSFQFANLARRMLAEGALNAAFVPLYLKIEAEDGQAAASAFAGRMLGTLTAALAIMALALAVAMPLLIHILAPGFETGDPRAAWAIAWARLMLPYLVLAGPAALLMAMLNAKKRFAGAAWVAASFNLVILCALAVVFVTQTGDSDLSARILAIAVSLAGLCQFLLVALVLRRGRISPLRPALSFGPQTRAFTRLAIPGLIANGIPQLTVMTGIMAASATPGALSWLYYAQRLIELPLGIVGVALGTVLVPALSHAIHNGERSDVVAAETRGLELAIGLALPAAIALIVLAQPIVRTLFERGAFSPEDTAATALALAIFASGLPAQVMIKAWAPLFFARGDTKTPMHAALIGLIAAAIGSFTLMPVAGHAGVAAAIAFSGWLSAATLAVFIQRRIGFSLTAGNARRIARIVAAAVVMGFAVTALRHICEPWLASGAQLAARLMALAALIVFGLGLYGGALRALGVVRRRDLYAALRRVA
jgi:putative peptidoglycan lipid II flippase